MKLSLDIQTYFTGRDRVVPEGEQVLNVLSLTVQSHVHRVSGAIQPSNPLSSRPPPAFNLSQLEGLF